MKTFKVTMNNPDLRQRSQGNARSRIIEFSTADTFVDMASAAQKICDELNQSEPGWEIRAIEWISDRQLVAP